MAKLHINYTKNGEPVSDFKSLEFVLNAWLLIKGTTQEKQINICNETIINAVRVLVMRGEINHNELFIYYEGDILELNAIGEIKIWPKGFCDTNVKYLNELFGI